MSERYQNLKDDATFESEPNEGGQSYPMDNFGESDRGSEMVIDMQKQNEIEMVQVGPDINSFIHKKEPSFDELFDSEDSRSDSQPETLDLSGSAGCKSHYWLTSPL